ncbi:L-histidine N(alpha)-methyltransferase [Streptomyces carpaticus]|uniref:L-histidine N(Alpha)-methyltransferase n=1 Tax=Streptomyces carpaticus TaxID=285558 RepID=A0ABV4ZRI2_9ACTN
MENLLPAGHRATSLAEDVRNGLSGTPKTLPPKWFYDERGSKLFDRITRLPEYYLTRAERQILRVRAPEIAALTGARVLVELGSGSSRKTRMLVDALSGVATTGPAGPQPGPAMDVALGLPRALGKGRKRKKPPAEESPGPEPDAATVTGTMTAEPPGGSGTATGEVPPGAAPAGTLELYAPIDVSESALQEAGDALCRDYPELRVHATVADFDTGLVLPDLPGPRLIAFLGSTLGNFDPARRAAFYAELRGLLRPDDALLLGVDLVKDPATMRRAYNDEQGVTPEFNKNVLRVLNRELGADFDLNDFDHRAVWNEEEERMEMRLWSRFSQTVRIPALGMTVDFGRGEETRTEISTKFRRAGLTEELLAAGLAVDHWWTDPQDRFALLLVTSWGSATDSADS